MSEEINPQKNLQQIADDLGMELQYGEEPYQTNAVQRVVYHRREAVIHGDNYKDLPIVFYNDSRNMTRYDMYCGVFIPLEIASDNKLIIRKKDITDRLNPFKPKKTYKTGIVSFDNRVITTGEFDDDIKQLLNNRQFLDRVLDIFDLDIRLQLTANEVNPAFCQQLNGKSNLAIQLFMDWIEDTNKLKQILEIAQDLKKMS